MYCTQHDAPSTSIGSLLPTYCRLNVLQYKRHELIKKWLTINKLFIMFHGRTHVITGFCSLQLPVSVPQRIHSTSRNAREEKTLSEINCKYFAVSQWILPVDSFLNALRFCFFIFYSLAWLFFIIVKIDHLLHQTYIYMLQIKQTSVFLPSVGQVKFDPPLRKETEPHHDPVSAGISAFLCNHPLFPVSSPSSYLQVCLMKPHVNLQIYCWSF